MKTRLLAAVMVVAALFGAASAQAGDGQSTAGNLQGEALQVFVTPLTNVGATVISMSLLPDLSIAVTINATIYWIEVEVIAATANASSTGFDLFSWSASTTGGMTSAAGANGAYNHRHFVPFGTRAIRNIGADDELARHGPYSEGLCGTPIRRVYPTVYIGNGPNSLPGATNDVLIRFGTRPYGVQPEVRGRRGAS